MLKYRYLLLNGDNEFVIFRSNVLIMEFECDGAYIQISETQYNYLKSNGVKEI